MVDSEQARREIHIDAAKQHYQTALDCEDAGVPLGYVADQYAKACLEAERAGIKAPPIPDSLKDWTGSAFD